MKSYTLTIQGETFTVDILQDPRQDRVRVRVNGEILIVDVKNECDSQEQPVAEIKAALKIEPPAPHTAGSAAVLPVSSAVLTAPLPGVVIQILVQQDQAVNVGDELLVIEAMKMNNRIRSPKSGTVGHVFVKIGENVNHGSPLLDWIE